MKTVVGYKFTRIRYLLVLSKAAGLRHKLYQEYIKELSHTLDIVPPQARENVPGMKVALWLAGDCNGGCGVRGRYGLH